MSDNSQALEDMERDDWVGASILFLIGLTVVTSIVAPLATPDANSIADTISDVAAGPYSWIQDLGFYTEAVALVLLIWLMRKRADGTAWGIAQIALFLMAVSLAVMASYEEYGDGDFGGFVIHHYMVYTYGFGFLLVLLTTLPVLKERNSIWLWVNLLGGGVWFAIAAFYFNMGTQWDGVVERALGMMQLGWIVGFAWYLAWQFNRAARSSP